MRARGGGGGARHTLVPSPPKKKTEPSGRLVSLACEAFWHAPDTAPSLAW